jgi:hypothetical protein
MGASPQTPRPHYVRRFMYMFTKGKSIGYRFFFILGASPQTPVVLRSCKLVDVEVKVEGVVPNVFLDL